MSIRIRRHIQVVNAISSYRVRPNPAEKGSDINSDRDLETLLSESTSSPISAAGFTRNPTQNILAAFPGLCLKACPPRAPNPATDHPPLPPTPTIHPYHPPLPPTPTIHPYHPPLPPIPTTHPYHPPLPPTPTIHPYHPPLPPTLTTHPYHPPLPPTLTTHPYHTPLPPTPTNHPYHPK